MRVPLYKCNIEVQKYLLTFTFYKALRNKYDDCSDALNEAINNAYRHFYEKNESMYSMTDFVCSLLHVGTTPNNNCLFDCMNGLLDFNLDPMTFAENAAANVLGRFSATEEAFKEYSLNEAIILLVVSGEATELSLSSSEVHIIHTNSDVDIASDIREC